MIDNNISKMFVAIKTTLSQVKLAIKLIFLCLGFISRHRQ